MGKTRDVREAVETELGYGPLVDATGISVKNINGEVSLTGTVPSSPQYLEAAQAAWRVGGVTEVCNHLEVDPHALATGRSAATAGEAAAAEALNGVIGASGEYRMEFSSARPA